MRARAARTTSRLGASPCRRASSPGTREPLRGVDVAERGVVGDEPLACGHVEPLGEHRAERLDLHLAEAGQGGDPRRRSSASAASVQSRSGFPSYSLSTRRASSRTRSAIAPGKRWIAGFSRKASPPGPSPRSFRVERADALLELERAGEGGLHRHLLVERETHQQRERLGCEQRVRLVVPVKWSFWTATAMPRILRLERGTVGR